MILGNAGGFLWGIDWKECATHEEVKLILNFLFFPNGRSHRPRTQANEQSPPYASLFTILASSREEVCHII